MSIRMLGLDTTLVLTAPTGPMVRVTKIASFSVTLLGEIVEEDYMNADSPEFMDVSNGIAVKLKLHHNDPQTLVLFDQIDQRRRRTIDPSASVFSAQARYRFPSGKIVRGVVTDISFGDIPIDMTSRKRLVESGLDGKASGPINWFGLY